MNRLFLVVGIEILTFSIKIYIKNKKNKKEKKDEEEEEEQKLFNEISLVLEKKS